MKSVKKTYMYELIEAAQEKRLASKFARYPFSDKEIHSIYSLVAMFSYTPHRFFKLSEDLSDMLQKTDIQKVKLKEFKLPFPNMYFVFDSKVYFDEKEGVEIEGVGVQLFEDLDFEEFGTDVEGMMKDRALNIFIILSSNKKKMIRSIYTDTFDNEEEIEDLAEYIFRSGDTNKKYAKNMVRVLFGAILYMNNYKQECKVTTRLPSAKRKKGKVKKVDHEHVFMDIPIKLKTRLQEYRDAIEKGSWSIDHCFWVRGHWRQYENKRIWIHPYMKGSEYDIMKEKHYDMNV